MGLWHESRETGGMAGAHRKSYYHVENKSLLSQDMYTIIQGGCLFLGQATHRPSNWNTLECTAKDFTSWMGVCHHNRPVEAKTTWQMQLTKANRPRV